jgi:hypothetical protein
MQEVSGDYFLYTNHFNVCINNIIEHISIILSEEYYRTSTKMQQNELEKM